VVGTLVVDPAAVASWQFMPVLQTIVETRKVKRLASGELEKAPTKKRLICYAAHRDAALYEYYAHLLSDRYEEIIKTSDIASSVIALDLVSENAISILHPKHSPKFLSESPASLLLLISKDSLIR